MIPFAVTIEGVTDQPGAAPARWALAVTEGKLLTATEYGELVWYPLEQCRFSHCDSPRPVVVVETQRVQLRRGPNGLTLP